MKVISNRSGQSSSLGNGNTASLYTSYFPCTELSVDDRFLQFLLPSESQPRDSPSHNSVETFLLFSGHSALELLSALEFCTGQSFS